MVPHSTVKKSFFIKFLLFTAIAGNVYVLIQAVSHLFNIHVFDFYLRWYAFNAPAIYNIGVVFSTSIVIYALLQIYKKGVQSFKLYFVGKLLMYGAYLILIWMEYKLVKLPFPYLTIPVLLFTQLIYPILLYLSLRKTKKQ